MFAMIDAFLGRLIKGFLRLCSWSLIIVAILLDEVTGWSNIAATYLMDNCESVTTHQQAYCLIFGACLVIFYIMINKMYNLSDS